MVRMTVDFGSNMKYAKIAKRLSFMHTILYLSVLYNDLRLFVPGFHRSCFRCHFIYQQLRLQHFYVGTIA